MLELLQYGFMQKALIGAGLTVILCAVAGVLIVVNRLVYISGGISHASYGGIGLALWLGYSPTGGAMLLAVILAVILARVRNYDLKKADALVSAFWAAGMAVGIILGDITPGYSKDFLNYLFGNLLLISDSDLYLTGGMALLSVILAVKYYNIILAVSADRDYALTLGIPVKLVDALMLIFLCSAVVTLIKISGLILIMALLSMPASIAETRVKKLSHMMWLSGVVAAFVIFTGLGVAVAFNLTPSAVIVLLLTIAYMLNGVIKGKL